MKQDSINLKSYNQICNEWSEFRSKCVINHCIEEFSLYFKEKSKILDIGCGSGFPIDSFLENKGFFVYGIDIAKNMIQKAKSLNLKNAKFKHIDFLKYKTFKRFDGIIAFDSLWHIRYEKQDVIYQKLAKMLKIGGYILFTHGKEDDKRYSTMFNHSFYYASLALNKIKILLNKNGLKIIKCVENYKEITTGERDLLIIAQKIR